MNRTSKKQAKIIVHPASIRLMTDATWEYAHKILWNNHPFTKKETEQAKALIQEYYESIPSEKFAAGIHRYFSGYCIRILMARNYVLRRPQRYIPHPCIWIDKRNPKGFAGTKAWYDAFIQEQHYVNQRFRPQSFSKTA
ncbi:MAG TPA: hypothetical protein DDX39_12030 [Bacteroidales bacterium]|nr:MAG: hypothetical protein A2W98_11435 [Bacteroidetes bacterium GWF2_33_38]OFY92055.1 MAG: hypothetical protein A2236_08850 [Bacteroidetes bacterium RIFOXYA2_FULL_33_7]HBF89360.1 hypothetical protein [Bacteroidales bacterium]